MGTGPRSPVCSVSVKHGQEGGDLAGESTSMGRGVESGVWSSGVGEGWGCRLGPVGRAVYAVDHPVLPRLRTQPPVENNRHFGRTGWS